jgi:hypothetical protein
MEAEELSALGNNICLEGMVIVSIKEEVVDETSTEEGGECFDITFGAEDTEEYLQEAVKLKDMEGNRSVY